MNSPSIINESQEDNSSMAMVRSIRKIVKLDVGGSAVACKGFLKHLVILVFAKKGEETPSIRATVVLIHFRPTGSPFSKVLVVDFYWTDEKT